MTTYNSSSTKRFRPKSRKAKKKSIYRWLRERTSSVDYGFKYNGHPIHCNPNEKVLDAFNGGKWLSRMTNEKFNDHFSGEKTHYFTGNGSPKFPETLLNIDIDCHKTGTLAGAIAFAEYLRDSLFPNLYFEASTNGNGVHGYIVIEKADLGATILNELSRRLQQHLRQILSTTNFDVQDVEIKGTCPVLVWGDRKGQLQNYASGTLAQPGAATRAFAPDEVSFVPVREWRSPRTGRCCFLAFDIVSLSRRISRTMQLQPSRLRAFLMSKHCRVRPNALEGVFCI